jgi:hypothetical protein
VVDADPVAVQVREIAPESTPDIERSAEPQSSDVPAIRRLDIQRSSPARLVETMQSLGIFITRGRTALLFVLWAYCWHPLPPLVTVLPYRCQMKLETIPAAGEVAPRVFAPLEQETLSSSS